MDCRPDSLETLLYPWAVFGMIVAPSFFVAERLIDGYAVKVVRRAGGMMGGGGAPPSRDAARDLVVSVRALNLSLVLYALLLTCLLVLLGCIVTYSGASLVHLCIEAMFRMEPTWIDRREVRQMLHAADNLLDPALVFGFLSIRMWSVHAAVIVATLAAAAMHTWLLLSPARLMAMMRARRQGEGQGEGQTEGEGGLSADLVAGAFRETYGFAASVLATLYLIVVSREVMLFLELRK